MFFKAAHIRKFSALKQVSLDWFECRVSLSSPFPFWPLCLRCSPFSLSSFLIGPLIIMITIALKGAIRDFCTISLLRRELSPALTLKWPGRSLVETTCNTSGAHHAQHVCHEVQRDNSAIKLTRVEIEFILSLFYWLNPLTDDSRACLIASCTGIIIKNVTASAVGTGGTHAKVSSSMMIWLTNEEEKMSF